jgi:hypothetical protein
VWLDEELHGGETWWTPILRDIGECTVFLFALSDKSLYSKPCRAELRYANDLGVPVLPVQTGEVASPVLLVVTGCGRLCSIKQNRSGNRESNAKMSPHCDTFPIFTANTTYLCCQAVALVGLAWAGRWLPGVNVTLSNSEQGGCAAGGRHGLATRCHVPVTATRLTIWARSFGAATASLARQGVLAAD